MQFPTPANLIEWFASLTGKVLHPDTLAAEQEAQARARRAAEAEHTPRAA